MAVHTSEMLLLFDCMPVIYKIVVLSNTYSPRVLPSMQ